MCMKATQYQICTTTAPLRVRCAIRVAPGVLDAHQLRLLSVALGTQNSTRAHILREQLKSVHICAWPQSRMQTVRLFAVRVYHNISPGKTLYASRFNRPRWLHTSVQVRYQTVASQGENLNNTSNSELAQKPTLPKRIEERSANMPRTAAVLLVNKLKGESCTPVPSIAPAASSSSPSAGPVGSRPRAHADPGTGLVLLQRLASMGVLSKTASDLGPSASPGLGWTVSTGLDVPSEGLVCVASHGWLAEWIRQQGQAVQELYGRAGADASSLCEYRVRVRGRLRQHQVRHLAAGPILKEAEGLQKANKGKQPQVLPPIHVLSGRTVEDVEGQGEAERAKSSMPAAGGAGQSRSQEGSAQGSKRGQDGKEGKRGAAEKHNEWYTLRTDITGSRTLRQLFSSLGCPPSRIIRTRYGPWSLTRHIAQEREQREPGQSGNRSTKDKSANSNGSPTIPPGAALLVPVPRRVLLTAWTWAHGGKDATGAGTAASTG